MGPDPMLEEGIRMGAGSWDHETDTARLRRAHPGFGDRALSRARDRGHLVHR